MELRVLWTNMEDSLNKISNKNLEILIAGLSQYRKDGVNDPWIISDGTMIQPLDVLIELRELRKKHI